VCAAGRGAAHPPAHAVAVPVGQCDDRLQRVEAQPLAGLARQVQSSTSNMSQGFGG